MTKTFAWINLSLLLLALGQIFGLWYWGDNQVYLSLEGPFLSLNPVTDHYATTVHSLWEVPLLSLLTVVWGLVALSHLILFLQPTVLSKILKDQVNPWTWLNLALPTSLLTVVCLWLIGASDPVVLILVWAAGFLSAFLGWQQQFLARRQASRWRWLFNLTPLVAGVPVLLAGAYLLWHWLYEGGALSGYHQLAYTLVLAYYLAWLLAVGSRSKPFKITPRFVQGELVGEFTFKTGLTWIIALAVLL